MSGNRNESIGSVAMRPIRVGLIGAGLIGQLRAHALDQVPGLRLAAVADIRPELVATIVGGRSQVRSSNDGFQLAADPDLDAVIIATPPNSHKALGLACLATGKHVMCEKPLAPTPEDCESLVCAAETANVHLATGFNLRFSRAALLARRLLDDGAIGDLDHIRAFHGHPGGAEFTHDWVFDRDVTGGGALMDNGIHLIDLTRWFLGGADEFEGYATNRVWRKPGCEDNGFLLLKNTRNCVAVLHASWTEWRGYNYRIEIFGTKGYIRFGYPPLHLIHGRVESGRTTRMRYWFPGYQVRERVRGWKWGLVETLQRELAAWQEMLTGGRSTVATGRDGCDAVRLAHAARRIFVDDRSVAHPNGGTC